MPPALRAETRRYPGGGSAAGANRLPGHRCYPWAEAHIAAQNDRRIRSFVQRYGEALGNGDLTVIVESWGVPSLVVSDRGLQPVERSAQVEALFRSAIAEHRKRKLVTTRPEVEGLERLAERVYSVDVRWTNLDGDGIERASERWRYVLRAAPDEAPRIYVAIMKAGGER